MPQPQMTITRIDIDEAAAMSAASKSAEAAAKAGAEKLLDAANHNVPFLTGELEGTGRVEYDDEAQEAFVVYDARYARVLRAHPEWDYSGGRSGRWLDEAVASTGQDVGQTMEQAAQSEWPG